MNYNRVIGQKRLQHKLQYSVTANKVAHAQLFHGKTGHGTLALALDYAKHLLCLSPSDNGYCGHCQSCLQASSLSHPDLHFSFPVVKVGSRPATSDTYLPQWKSMISETPYPRFSQWLSQIEAGNKQAVIYEAESESIIKKLSRKAFYSGLKILIIWQASRMNTACSNKLLKSIEEPSEGTVIILLEKDIENILPTIKSRCQIWNVSPILQSDIEESLESNYPTLSDVSLIARLSKGNYSKANQLVETLYLDSDFFESFTLLMRTAYTRNIIKLRHWSDQVASGGREEQRAFLSYVQNMLRENFFANFRQEDIQFMSPSESKFAQRFSPFINEKNVYPLMNVFDDAQRDIVGNVNAKMVFFDLSLKVIMLLKQN